MNNPGLLSSVISLIPTNMIIPEELVRYKVKMFVNLLADT